jgi:hypothetical protein
MPLYQGEQPGKSLLSDETTERKLRVEQLFYRRHHPLSDCHLIFFTDYNLNF